MEVTMFPTDTPTFEAFTTFWLQEHAEKQLERKTISSYRAELNSKILPADRKYRTRKTTTHTLGKLFQCSITARYPAGREAGYILNPYN
jgi:hypothetical protein